jgi:glycosyltransferase involved in cell wall biosynthesis
MDRPLSASGKKPKALFLSAEAPYPAVGGGPLRSASLLEYLARRYAVHAIVFRQDGEADPNLAIPPGRVERLDVIDLPYHSKLAVARAIRNASRLVRNRPPLVDRFSGSARHLSALLAGEQYDTAVIEHFWCAPYIEQVRPHCKNAILDLHNIESVWHRTLADSERALRSWALRRFATASVTLERRWLPKFDSILTTSTADAELARRLAPGTTVAVYPNALPETPQPPRLERQEVVFSGNLEYPPNISAVRFFHQSIWPVLQSRWPELKWRIVGKSPDAIRPFVAGEPHIQVTGFVEDAVAVLAECQVAVIPLLAGSGTRVKILEAWAAGTSVVSTTLGAQGLDCADETDLLIADEPLRFADAVSRLLASPEDRLRIGSAGRRLFEQRYTWPAAWRTLDRSLETVSQGERLTAGTQSPFQVNNYE